MEEQIKKTLPDLDSDKKEDDKDTTKYMMFFFIPVIVITILCFRYNTLRLIVLGLSVVFMCYSSYKTYKERAYRFDKEILSQLILVFCSVLAIFFKFFGDLVLAYMALLFVCLLYIFTKKLEESKQKKYITYYVFFGSIITAVILNYEDILLLLKKLINYF